MLRFNSNGDIFLIISTKFQYILCYGSTMKITIEATQKEYFNTSYVTVQLLEVELHAILF